MTTKANGARTAKTKRGAQRDKPKSEKKRKARSPSAGGDGNAWRVQRVEVPDLLNAPWVPGGCVPPSPGPPLRVPGISVKFCDLPRQKRPVPPVRAMKAYPFVVVPTMKLIRRIVADYARAAGPAVDPRAVIWLTAEVLALVFGEEK